MENLSEKKVLDYLRGQIDCEILELDLDRSEGVYFKINMSESGKSLLNLTWINIEIYSVVVFNGYTQLNMFIREKDIKEEDIFDNVDVMGNFDKNGDLI